MYSIIDVKKFTLRGVNLSIPKGEIFGITGQSGAGKSTLLRCLAGLIQPTSGTILFQGQDIAQFDEKALRAYRRKMGMIFQHFHLFSSRTVAENVAYPLEIAGQPKEGIDELLKLVGMLDKKNAYPSTLSGGEKQRAALARALIHRPEVLLCDEATSALDPQTKGEILDLLQAVNLQLGGHHRFHHP